MLENYLVITNPDSKKLLIAFTGFANRLMVNPFEFFTMSNTLGFNRILIKDPSRRLCLAGIGPPLDSFELLLDRIKADRAAISPEKTYVLGTSGGGHSALLFGHLIKADIIHAFAPSTCTGLWNRIKQRRWQIIIRWREELLKLSRLPSGVKTLFDLKPLLAGHNGVSRFNIHVCGRREPDVTAANYLKECKNVEIFHYPCDSHNVARYMIKNGLLAPLFADGGKAESGS